MRNRGTYGKGAKGKADKLFSLIVRSAGRCASCGRTENLQCAHVVPRTYNATRCDFENALCLCAGCHRRFTDRPWEWVSFVGNHLGPDTFERLYARAREGVGTKVDWDDVAADLAAQWARIEKRAS